MDPYKTGFIELMAQSGVLLFGDFTTKAGRQSPYFINTGLYRTGAQAEPLSAYYARLIQDKLAGQYDALFGPAYKGIPLCVLAAAALWRLFGVDAGYCFNRKEAKDHGEGGHIVGAPLKGRVLIVDDVISAGTSVRESVELIRQAGAAPAGVLIALDRQERGASELSAVQEVMRDYGIPVAAIAGLGDLMAYLGQHPEFAAHRASVARYREQYGVDA